MSSNAFRSRGSRFPSRQEPAGGASPRAADGRSASLGSVAQTACRAAVCASCASAALLVARRSWTCSVAEVRGCLLEARPARPAGEEGLQRQGVLRQPFLRQLCLCRSTFVVCRLASKCQSVPALIRGRAAGTQRLYSV